MIRRLPHGHAGTGEADDQLRTLHVGQRPLIEGLVEGGQVVAEDVRVRPNRSRHTVLFTIMGDAGIRVALRKRRGLPQSGNLLLLGLHGG